MSRRQGRYIYTTVNNNVTKKINVHTMYMIYFFFFMLLFSFCEFSSPYKHLFLFVCDMIKGSGS